LQRATGIKVFLLLFLQKKKTCFLLFGLTGFSSFRVAWAPLPRQTRAHMTDAPITQEGLRAAIGLRSAVMLVVGGVIGVGVFVNPAVVARSLHSPGLALVAWVLGGAVAVLGAFIYAELAARMPSTGGEYVYLRDTYGPLAGFLFGWSTLLVVHAGGMAAVSIIFAENVLRLLPVRAPEGAIVLAVLSVLTVINCLGVRAGNGAQAGLGVLKLICLAALIGAGLLIAPHALPPVAAAPPDTAKSFGAAMIAVVFTYGGWQTANYVAGEMRDPARTLGRALLIGMVLICAVYLLVDLACERALGAAALGGTLTPASDVLQRAIGPAGARLAAGAIALSALGYLGQGMLTGPRVLFAMARDGLFFRSMAQLSETSRVPAGAILVFGAWTAVLALSGSYESILSYDIATNFLFFGLSASCLFVLRRADPRGGGPYRAPLHPWSTGIFVLACAGIVAVSFWNFPLNSVVGYAIMALGIPPYLYWRRRAVRGSGGRQMT
jgi:APA family basic amino acid/polyamine antiporter